MQRKRFTGSGVIVQDGKRTTLECTFEVQRNDSSSAWRGSYEGADPVQEPEVGDAALELSPSNAGRIVITDAFVGQGSGWFIGNGPPPQF